MQCKNEPALLFRLKGPCSVETEKFSDFQSFRRTKFSFEVSRTQIFSRKLFFRQFASIFRKLDKSEKMRPCRFFSCQKMHDVPKQMKNQFSDFCDFLFLSYGRLYTHISSKNQPILTTKTTISQKLKIA